MRQHEYCEKYKNQIVQYKKPEERTSHKPVGGVGRTLPPLGADVANINDNSEEHRGSEGDNDRGLHPLPGKGQEKGEEGTVFII